MSDTPVKNENGVENGHDNHVTHKPVIQQVRRKSQPVPFKYAVTEIRATENPKGGIAYEVILSPPIKEITPKRPSSPPKSTLSIDDIESKLKAAEKRRESIDAGKLDHLADLRSRVEEAAAKRTASLQQFVEEKKEIMEKKLMTASEKREANILCKIEKLKEHEEMVQKKRRQLEERQQELASSIERKLETVSEKRELVIQRKIESLKDHDRRVEEIRNLKLLSATQSSG